MEAKEVKGLVEAYASVYTNLSESHFKVGDKVICKASGMTGEVVKLDKEHGEEDEKYYTVEREDGKKMKYAPSELKSAENEKNGGASKKAEGKFHKKLDKLVHKTFGERPEERGMKEEVETDLFDYILEHLVAEGYADTNEAALAIMANMSEEWRQSILDEGYKDLPRGKMYNKMINVRMHGRGEGYTPETQKMIKVSQEHNPEKAKKKEKENKERGSRG